MTTEIQVVSFEESIQEFSNLKKICQQLMNTPHYKKLGEEGIIAILGKAKSMNFDPFEALNGAFYVVHGRVGMTTETMASLVRNAGHSITKDLKSDDIKCILHGKRADNGDTWTTTFSIEDAKRAQIYQGIWIKYPAIMCYNRAMSILFRQLFPDLSKNTGYTPDEINEIVHQKQGHDSPLTELLINGYQKISTDQAIELNDLLSLCSEEYQERVMTHLKQLYPPVEHLEDVPVDLYERIKDGAIKNRPETITQEIESMTNEEG